MHLEEMEAGSAMPPEPSCENQEGGARRESNGLPSTEGASRPTGYSWLALLARAKVESRGQGRFVWPAPDPPVFRASFTRGHLKRWFVEVNPPLSTFAI